MDSRKRMRCAAAAEVNVRKAQARLSIAVAELHLRQAEFAWLAPSHWAEGSAQQSDELEERYEIVVEAKEELTRAKGVLANLEREL